MNVERKVVVELFVKEFVWGCTATIPISVAKQLRSHRCVPV